MKTDNINEFENNKKSILKNDQLEKLKDFNVIVFGIGGVGGYVVEMLVRAGIERITLVDFDIVERSNINRQIIADNSTIGKNKVDVMKQRILNINPNAKVDAVLKKFTKETKEEFNLTKFDYVVDAIDLVTHKIELILYCKRHNLNIVSAMGAGNRYKIPHFEVCDIYQTHNDGLAKIIRKKLRENNILHHTVVYTADDCEKNNEVYSISYYPAMCGILMSAKVINDLLEVK